MRDGWQQVPLGEVTTQYIEPLPLQADEEYTNLGLRMYAQGTFLREPKRGAEIKADRLFKVRPGQFVYNRMFASGGSFGLVKPEDEGAVVSNEFPVFDLDEARVLPPFLELYFQQPEVWAVVAEQCVGTTKSRLRWKEDRFAAHVVSLPLLREQQRIVDLIGAVDDAITKAERLVMDLEQLTSKMRDALPGGELRPISEVVTAIQSGVSTKPVAGEGPQLNMLTLAAIRPGRFYPSEVKSVGAAALPEKTRLHDGDLLITRSNTPERVGYVALARDVSENTFLPDLVWRLVVDESVVSREYLAQVLSSPTMRAAITASATGTSQSMQKINKTNFGALRIPVPDLETQGTYVEPIVAIGDALRLADSELADLRRLRTNLLTALLSGEHEIPESYDELMEVSA